MSDKKSDDPTVVTDNYVTRREGEETNADTFARKLAEKREAEHERVTTGKSLPSSLARPD